MKYYPVFIDIKNKNCLVVGGGSVGLRKAVTLEKCGAKVKVISQKFSSGFDKLKTTSIDFLQKDYENDDVRKDVFFVFAATGNAGLNLRIKKRASKFGILCNIADSLDKSDFILPSIVDRGDLVLAVSTSGTSPAMAKKIRQDLEHCFGNEYAVFLTLMGNIRRKLLSAEHAPDDHKKIFHSLINRGVLSLIKKNDTKKIDLILYEILGENYLYQNLIASNNAF